MKLKIVFMLGMLTNLAVSQNVVINELMYGPSGGQPEWIELYNNGQDSINLKSWSICDKNRVRYSLEPADRFLKTKAYLILTNSDSFAQFHPEAAGNYVIVNWSQYFLVNSGDTVSLYDADSRLVDSVFYAPSWGGSNGKSLERRSPEESSRSKENWGTTVDPAGSTPGRMNSITLRKFDLEISSLSARYIRTESEAILNVLVKNPGTNDAASFRVKLYVDYDRDSIADPAELIAVDSSNGMNHGDSTLFRIEKTLEDPGVNNAIGVLEFPADENLLNNIAIERFSASFSTGSIIINEIMYAPVSPAPEWVELFNTSKDSICLCGFSLADNSGSKSIFPDSAVSIPPGEYAVVAHDSGFFTYNRNFTGLAVIVKIPSLNNSGDAVVIRDASGQMIDSVEYSPSWGGNSGGKSLERILPTGESNDPQNYESCQDTTRSTPGRINSVTPRDFDLAVGRIEPVPATLQSGDSAVIMGSVLNVGVFPFPHATVILYEDLNNDLRLTPGETRDSSEVGPILPGDSTEVGLDTGPLVFGAHRFGVTIVSTEDQRTSNDSRMVTLNVGLPRAGIVINEVMYNPKSPEQEWIELFNAGSTIADLSNFRITTHGGSTRIKSGSLIAPKDYAVICRDSSVSDFHYPVRDLFLQSTPSLSNSGDVIALHDNWGNLLDSMNYLPSYGGESGRSIEKVDYLAGNDSTNWQESADSTGATPGRENSVAILPFDIAAKAFDMSASPRTPGQKGVVSIVIENNGRNPASGISVSMDVVREVDSVVVFQENRSISETIAPKDSATAHFAVAFDRSGLYKAFATVVLQNDPRPRNDTVSASFNIGYPERSIVLNEIMFTKSLCGEYFELYNSTANDVSLNGWTFHTSSSNWKTLGDNRVMRTAGYFVVGADSSLLTTVQDTNAAHVSKSMSLRDDGDCVVIIDPSGDITDSVYYLPSWHNSDIANPAGRSLEKINPSLPSNEKTSWSTCVSQSGGTPAAKNSLYIETSQTTGSVSVQPNPFSPDGDGHDDFTFVSYSFPVSSVKIRIRIFDSAGRLISTPVDNLVLQSTGKLIWDGRDTSGRIVKFGLYIMFMEITGPDGRSLSTYKTPLVVAKKLR